MASYNSLFSTFKSYALEQDLDVTWGEVRGEFREKYDTLKTHEKRKIRVEFEGWITRERQKRSEAAA